MPTTTLSERLDALTHIDYETLVASADISTDADADRGSEEDDIDDEEDEEAVVVARDVPVEVWNALFELEEQPHGISLRFLMWHDGTVSIVEYPSPEHGASEYEVSRRLSSHFSAWAIVNHSVGIATPGRPTRPSYEPDLFDYPHRSLIGAQSPANLKRTEWAIVEILRNQRWSSVHHKVTAYRNRPGVQYIICVRMSKKLQHWSYEFYDVGDADSWLRWRVGLLLNSRLSGFWRLAAAVKRASGYEVTVHLAIGVGVPAGSDEQDNPVLLEGQSRFAAHQPAMHVSPLRVRVLLAVPRL
jgi:hypothetical protein